MFCPLDCWDSCQLSLDGSRFIPTGISRFLCWKMNNYFYFPPETTARWKGKPISIGDGLNRLVKLLSETPPEQILYLKGSGNMGFFNSLPLKFFGEFGATIGIGSTCDGIGNYGIIQGRGTSHILPLWIIQRAKRIVLWGRNSAVTNIHLLPLIKGKPTVVIDPIETATARLPNSLHIPIRPNRDYFLAILLAKWIVSKGEIRNRTGIGFNTYLQLLDSYREEELLVQIGVDKSHLLTLLELLLEGAVILTGLGVAKCAECWKTHWAIDSLAHLLDYFGKEDRGVAFLGSSSAGLSLPFNIKIRRSIPLFNLDLKQYRLIFIQGSNPLISYPNRHLWEKISQKRVVVYGRYWDKTAQIATLFIPTDGFYNKVDLRGSYFHQYVLVNFAHQIKPEGISEYDFTQYLLRQFKMEELPSEEALIEQILLNSQLEEVENISIEIDPSTFSQNLSIGDFQRETNLLKDNRNKQVRHKSNYQSNSRRDNHSQIERVKKKKKPTFEKLTTPYRKVYRKKIFDTPPYLYKFPTPTGQFHFLTVPFTPPSLPFHLTTGKFLKGLNSQFLQPKQVWINPNPSPYLRRWIDHYLHPSQLRFTNRVPPDIIHTFGGSISNRFYYSTGYNASYSEFNFKIY